MIAPSTLFAVQPPPNQPVQARDVERMRPNFARGFVAERARALASDTEQRAGSWFAAMLGALAVPERDTWYF